MERVLNLLNKYLMDNKIDELKFINIPDMYLRVELSFCHWFKVRFYWKNDTVTSFDIDVYAPFGWGEFGYTIKELEDLQNFMEDVIKLPNDKEHILWLSKRVKETYERISMEYGN